MSEWTKVRWTQARQVTRLMGIKDRDAPPEAVAPRTHCDSLKASGALADAVSFVGHALPRFESIQWAADQVKAIRGDKADEPERATFDIVERWLKDPDDTLRQAAYDSAAALEEAGPEQMLGYAVWFSGGSIAPPGLQPVLPQPEVCNRCAAGAVVIATAGAEDRNAALLAALAAGEKVATGAQAAG